MVTQFHRGDLRIRREERWEPVTDGAATATITGSIVDAPATLTGTAVLEPLAESGGARLKFRATVEVASRWWAASWRTSSAANWSSC